MFHIAVCDQEGENLRRLGTMMVRYLSCRHELHGQVLRFHSVQELINSGEQVNVCILNAELEGKGTMEAARRLKELCPDTMLVFFSGERNPGRAMEAYRLHALQYLSAPVEEKQIFETLDRAVYEGGEGLAQRIALNSTIGLVNLRVSDIIYAKSSGHRVTFYLRNGQTLESKCLRVSFGSIIDPLLQCGFIRCHDSYTVNLACAARLTAEGILLSEGTVVPVSTKKRGWVRDLLKYCGT